VNTIIKAVGSGTEERRMPASGSTNHSEVFGFHWFRKREEEVMGVRIMRSGTNFRIYVPLQSRS